jgi:hypothetical protein
MSQYRSTGGLDDAIASDGDKAFNSVNLRDQLNQLLLTEVRESVNGRMEGYWKPRKSVESRTGALVSGGNPLQLPFLVIDATKTISSASYLTNTVTITVTAHGFTAGTVGLARITGLTFSGTDPNGDRVVTYATVDTLTFPVTGVTAASGTGTLSQTPVNDSAAGNVRASCLFSNPNEQSKEYVIVALDTVAKKIDLDTYAVTTITYPASQTVDAFTDMQQCFDKVILFRDRKQALVWDGTAAAFTVMVGGNYSQPIIIDDASNTAVLNGVATVTHAAGHGLVEGDLVEIIDIASSPPTGPVIGNQYYVASITSATVFTMYVDWPDHSGGHKITFTKPQSSGGGFMHLPGAPWGTYFQRRLFVPYYYDQSGTSTIAWTDRNIRDEVAISDILDENTYDQIYNQFRISGGTADQVVAMHGFFDDTMIVLNRNSIHSISNTSGNLTDTVVRELTGEVGCLARKTVLMRGNTLYFLSDNGVYGLEFLNDYNLRGMDQPLSKNIQPYIDRINPDKADKAVAVYFDNRYFLAVPLDSVAGANDAIGNNAVLVYNFLNKGWESIDTYGNNQFIITDYITASGGVRNNLYTVTSNGGLHQMEFAESIQDRLSVSNIDNTIVTPQIAASLTSRGYNFGSLERKRFTDTQIQMQNLAGETGEYSISFAAEDPDFAATIGTTSTFLGGMLTPSTANEAETATIRCRIGGVRGFTGTLILNRTQGSPKVHSIMVAGSVTNRQIISQK